MHRLVSKHHISRTIHRRIVSLSPNEFQKRLLFVCASTPLKTSISFTQAFSTISLRCHGNVRCFSSGGTNSKSSPFKESKESPGKPKRKNVPISKTPRGQAAAKAKLFDDSMPGPLSANSSMSESSIVEHDDHAQNLTHFVLGGTPCDVKPSPFRLADYGDDSLYTLVLLRHGESEWNSLNKYTGWCDVNLTENGRDEARAAGRLLKENGIEMDHVFTSVLKRANFTTNMALNTAGQHWVPVTKTWRLNERHYGALQGYNKDTAYEELDIEQELVMEMRRSYNTPPPKMTDDHPYWHGNDRRCVLRVLQWIPYSCTNNISLCT